MSNPFTSVVVSSDYNAAPPSDDASQVSSNQLGWDKHLEKIGDPLKTAIESINTNAVNAFAKRLGTTFELKTADYSIATPGDQGKFFSVTGTTTITMPAVADAGDGFPVIIKNDGSAIVTVEGNASELIDGDTSISLAANEWALLTPDGSTWTAAISRVHVDPKVRFFKAADQSKTNNTISDDDDLQVTGLVAASIYKIEVQIIVTCASTTPNIQFAFAKTQSSQFDALTRMVSSESSGNPTTEVEDFWNNVRTASLDGTNDIIIKFEGIMHTHATLTTDFKLQWAQSVTNATPTIVKKGSWMTLTKLGAA